MTSKSNLGTFGFLLVALVAVAPPAFAEASPAAAAAAAATAAPAAPAAAPARKAAPKKYCMRIEATTGTRMSKGLQCKTKAEWQQLGAEVDGAN